MCRIVGAFMEIEAEQLYEQWLLSISFLIARRAITAK